MCMSIIGVDDLSISVIMVLTAWKNLVRLITAQSSIPSKILRNPGPLYMFKGFLITYDPPGRSKHSPIYNGHCIETRQLRLSGIIFSDFLQF